MQNFSAQEVIYYAISEEHTVAHRLYQEAIKKVWFAPIKINARVQYDNMNTTTSNMTLDAQYLLNVYFHKQELIDRNVKPREGDFIEFGQVVFEITSVTEPQLVFGQVNKKIMTKCVCVPSREGQMQVNSLREENIDNTHPIEPSDC